MAAVVISLNPDTIQWSQWSAFERLWQLAVIIMAAAATYFILLFLQGLRPDQLKQSH
jgi:hypothetical protein